MNEERGEDLQLAYLLPWLESPSSFSPDSLLAKLSGSEPGSWQF